MIKVLKASAGTGKTYRLSLEYVASLLRGESFEEIVVMTFTRKATAEIRERILSHIEDIIRNGSESSIYTSLCQIHPGIELDSDLLKVTYEKMLLNKDQINIYTIDSFINQIFKRAVAPYLGIYKYEIIDDDRNEEIIAEVFKELLDNPDDFQLMEKFLQDNTERNIDKYIALIKKVLNNRWKFMVMDYQPRQERKVGDIIYSLDQCLSLLEEVAALREEEYNKDFFIKDFKGIMTDYQQLEIREEKLNLVIRNYPAFYKNSFWNGRKVGKKSLAHLKEALDAEYNKFRQYLACHIFNTEVIPYEKQVYRFSSHLFSIYDRIKFKQKIFTHSDISNYTYKYFFLEELDLIDGNQVSDYFYDLMGVHIKDLFIDEFQDTSILQWKLLRPIIDRCEHVITVGDEKQSIYGWRGGEKELFANLDRILAARSETLNMCYRSQKQITAFVNRFFANLKEDWNYSEVNNLPQKDKGYLEVMVGGRSAKINTGSNSFARKSKEEREYLQQINENLCENLKIKIAASIKEKINDYSSVAVLARSNDDLSQIADELDKLDIPYLLESQDSIVEHEAVKPLYFLLCYLYTGDYFHLIKFLRSDLVGVNNTTLKYLLQNKLDVRGYLSGEREQLEDRDLTRFLAEVKSLLEQDYSQLCNYLVNKSGVLDLFAANPGALKNIYCFFEIMTGFESLAELMEYIEENRDSDQLKQVGIQKADGVRLLTIHKAKGLSFDSEYFYWKPGGGGGDYGELKIYVEFDEDYRQVDNYLLSNSRYSNIFAYLDIDFAAKNKKKEQMEEINNVYVALTRPENNLFFYIESPRQLKDAVDGRYWSDSSYQFYEQGILAGAEVEDFTELVTAKCKGILTTSLAENEKQDPVLPDLSAYFKREEVYESTLVEYNKNKNFSQKLQGNLKRLAGLAVHYYLEHVKYNTKSEREYARCMVLARYGNILGPGKLKQIFSRVEYFIDNNPDYFNDKKEIFTEYSLRDKESKKRFRIDRLLVDRQNNTIEIIDYKTGALREEAQLENYEALLTAKTGGHYRISSKFVEI